MKRILVEGSGGPAGIGYCRSLKKNRKKFWMAGTDTDPYYLIRSVVDKQILLFKTNDTKYIENLNFIINKFKIEFLHAQPDPVVRLISKYRKKINCQTFLPNHNTIKICQDKFQSYEKWKSAGLPIPKTYLIKKFSDLKNAFEKLGKEVWLREIVGAAGKNSLPTNHLETANNWIDFHKGWGHFTAAEMLSLNSITWSSIWKDGELIVAQGRKRLYWEFGNRTLSGITGLTGGAITKSDPEIDAISQKAIFAVDKNPNGIYGVDITYDKKGKPRLTEINIGRFFTTIEFFTKAGLNMPLIYTSIGTGMKIPKIKKILNPLPDNLCWIRGIDINPILLPFKKIKRYTPKKRN